MISSALRVWTVASMICAPELTSAPAAARGSAPATAASAPARKAPDWKPIAARVEAAAHAAHAKHPVGALSVGLIVGDAVVWTGHYGHVAGPQSPPPDGSTVYRLGSVTKNFTALMLVKLEQEDR